MQDGLATGNLNILTESGTTVSSTSGTFTNAGVTNLTVTTGTFTTLSGLPLAYPLAYTGSPKVGNLVIQTGQVSGAGIANPVVVSFGVPYAAAPVSVQITAIGSTALANQQYVAGTAAGSFVFNAAGSNTSYYWTSIGSGRV